MIAHHGLWIVINSKLDARNNEGRDDGFEQ
jgi:hypothetical protein